MNSRIEENLRKIKRNIRLRSLKAARNKYRDTGNAISLMQSERFLFWSKMYSRQIGKGQGYESLKKCITINIVDYKLLPIEKIHAVYHLTEDIEKHRLTDVLEIHFIDLERLRNSARAADSLDIKLLKWLRFLSAKTKGEMEMEAKKDVE